MARMIRKQIYIRPEQDEFLRRKSKELGISQSAVVRLAIDQNLQVRSEPTDKSAWRKELAFIEEREKIRTPQTGRKWTRYELYEDDSTASPR